VRIQKFVMEGYPGVWGGASSPEANGGVRSSPPTTGGKGKWRKTIESWGDRNRV